MNVLRMFLLALGFVGGAAFQRPVDQSASGTVTFVIMNAGMPVQGTMRATRCVVNFHPADLANSSITASADPATIDTGLAIRDKHLRRGDYLNVQQHPQITLVSTSLTENGRNNFTGDFVLTMKGVSKPVTIPFAQTRAGHATRYEGRFVINRLDFGVGEKSMVLGDSITIAVSALQDMRER